MLPSPDRRPALALLGIGAALLIGALLALWGTSQGLHLERHPNADPPLTLIWPDEGPPGERPLVLIGHGFAASARLMEGIGLGLARAGYAVALWDFQGHGQNRHPFQLAAQSGGGSHPLLPNAEAALAMARQRGLGQDGRLAILGHSMGSGVALAWGQVHPETGATIAISPVGQRVSPSLPRNLLLMAGTLERPFVRNAQARLAEAGGEGGSLEGGSARRLVIVPGVEHLSILYAPMTHDAIRTWLDGTFGPQPGGQPTYDTRLLPYGLGMVGAWLMGLGGAWLLGLPTISASPQPLTRRLGALGGGVMGATGLLWGVGYTGVGLRDLGGLLVGGYLFAWFALAGILGLALLGQRPPALSRRVAVAAGVAFVVLWAGVGVLGDLVWLPWWLIPARLLRWLPGALMLLPWFLVVGLVIGPGGPGARLGWWLGASAFLGAGLVAALALHPELGFLTLILPLLPIVLGLHALAAAPFRTPWAFALSGAGFVAWLLLAVFPLR